MDFIDGIEKKVKAGDENEYRPQEYVFSDGEGVEEGDLAAEESSDQEGFSDLDSGSGGEEK